jgi:hypothetical protein
MKTSPPEIFEDVERATSRKEKIRLLQTYRSSVLIGLLQLNYNPAFKMDLPEGMPPYKRDVKVPRGYSETNLYAEFRRMYVWMDPKVNLTKERKEQLFIQLLEGIHFSEADVLCLAKDKKLQTEYKSVTEDLVREAFPDILPAKDPEPIIEQIEKVVEKVTKPKKAKASLKGSPVTSNEPTPNLS